MVSRSKLHLSAKNGVKVIPTARVRVSPLVLFLRVIKINENVGTTLRDHLTHSGSGLDVPRDSSTCLDIITYDELTWYDTHESRRSRTAHQTASTRLRSTRPMQASRAHNSGDTHNAIQYRAERDAHDRTHTGLTRRRSRQRAQRPANGRPEAPRARVHTRESALARRSRRRLRRSRRSATCGALARRPGRTACRDREVPGLGGRLKEPLPCRPLRAVGEWEGSNGGTSRHRVAAGGPVVRISTCHRVDLDVGLSGCVTESTRVANRGE